MLSWELGSDESPKPNIKPRAVPAQQHAKNAKLNGQAALRKLTLEGWTWKYVLESSVCKAGAGELKWKS